jgi:hypothetical protein
MLPASEYAKPNNEGHIMINETGMNEIADFLRENHKDGHDIAKDRFCLHAWASDAEESMENGNGPSIEILAYESTSGVPETFTVSADGIE